MFNTTDYIIFSFLFIYFLFGLLKGFFRSLLGPVSFIAGILCGLVYYWKTGNVFLTIAIYAFAPFVIHFIGSLILNIWNKNVSQEAKPSVISRLSGGFVSMIWSGCFLTVFLIFLVLVPGYFQWLKNIQADIGRSASFQLIEKVSGKNLLKESQRVATIPQTLNDPDQRKKIEQTKEFKELMENEKFRALMNDTEFSKKVETRDFSAIISNPRLQEIFQDPELLKKILALNQTIIKEDTPTKN